MFRGGMPHVANSDFLPQAANADHLPGVLAPVYFGQNFVDAGLCPR